MVISDRHSIRCFDDQGASQFEFDDGSLYAVQPLSGEFTGVTAVGVITDDGVVETRLYRGGTAYAPPVPVLLATHQVSPDITLAAPAGKVSGLIAGVP